eukprot:s822_g2.t1
MLHICGKKIDGGTIKDGSPRQRCGIDTEFLDTKQPSGSTGTFALAIPSTDGKTVELRVVCSDDLTL